MWLVFRWVLKRALISGHLLGWAFAWMDCIDFGIVGWILGWIVLLEGSTLLSSGIDGTTMNEPRCLHDLVRPTFPLLPLLQQN